MNKTSAFFQQKLQTDPYSTRPTMLHYAKSESVLFYVEKHAQIMKLSC